LQLRLSTSKFVHGVGVTTVSRTNTPAVKLDPVNRRIIEILQREGRRPLTVIARELGISEAAVRGRVRRLTDAGVMDVVAVTNPLLLGFEVMALVGVQANSDIQAVARVVSDWPETSYVVITSGSYDLLVEVVCEHNRHLLETVQRLREIPGVKSTETFMYLDMVKMTYAWGTR
jgi:Lrp/AsnC family transcriptional regulator for asnA, asnC and gidA